MVDLPESAPASLTWFVAWAALSLALAFVNDRLLSDHGGQLEREVQRRAARTMDALNNYLGRNLIGRLHEERPVSNHSELTPLYRAARDAWNPQARFARFNQLGRLCRIFCGLHFIAALTAGALWWAIEDRRDIITWIDASVFAVLLLPIAACVGYQTWAHFVLSEGSL